MKALVFASILALGLIGQSGLFPAQAAETPHRHFLRKVGANPNVLVYVYALARMAEGVTVGRGECTDLVDAALAYARKRPGRNYVWGTPVSQADMKAGDIIQFWDVHFTSPNGSTWGTAPGGHHTAIVRTVDGTKVLLVHQNDGVRRITLRRIDLAWSHTGKYNIYRPVPQ